jgi:hypothetical protein
MRLWRIVHGLGSGGGCLLLEFKTLGNIEFLYLELSMEHSAYELNII